MAYQNITGLAESKAKLLGVAAKVQKQLLRKAVGAGSKIVLKAVKAAQVATDSGTLRRSLGRKVKVYRNSGTVVGLVGARRGYETAVVRPGKRAARPAVPAFYSHLVELGTRPHAVARGSKLARRGKADAGQSGGMHPGTPARPFMAPAARASSEAVRADMAEVVSAGVEAAARGAS